MKKCIIYNNGTAEDIFYEQLVYCDDKRIETTEDIAKSISLYSFVEKFNSDEYLYHTIDKKDLSIKESDSLGSLVKNNDKNIFILENNKKERYLFQVDNHEVIDISGKVIPNVYTVKIIGKVMEED